MLDQLFTQTATIARHRAAPVVGSYLDEFVGRLAHLGYRIPTIRQFLRGSEEFGRFLFDKSVRLADVTNEHVMCYLALNASESPGVVSIRRSAVRVFLRFLRDKGVVATPTPSITDLNPANEAVLSDYLSFMQHHGGLREATIESHRTHVSRFLKNLEYGPDTIRSVTTAHIDGFICDTARRMRRRSMVNVSAALRSFVGYLHRSGLVDRDLSSHVARPRIYQLETMPRGLKWEDVLRLVAEPDRSSVAGRRDYAVLLFLAVYGVRAKELRTLLLEDIDWRGERVLIRRSKTATAGWYPLHPQVGEAIIEYLRNGRPDVCHREVFLTLKAPPRPFPHSTVVSALVERYLRRAEIRSGCRGAHVLRHARAINLLQQGFSLESIGDLLGHRRRQTTFIYAKAAIDDLRGVGLEITEVAT